jgi:hypothetical protein
LPLTNGHGRYTTVTPERALFSVEERPSHISIVNSSSTPQPRSALGVELRYGWVGPIWPKKCRTPRPCMPIATAFKICMSHRKMGS